MSPEPFDGVTILITLIVRELAPAVLPALREEPRARRNPGLAAASATLEAWTRELANSPCPAEALTEDRLAAVLRASFVAAASLGRIVVERRDGAFMAELELWPHDVALIEAMHELAVTLDARRGSTVCAAYSKWCDDTLAKMFGLARQRADLDACG